MAKIDPKFPHQIFRFVIEGLRNELLERWYGIPGGVDPEKSQQGIFEATQTRIQQLPLLHDPDFADAELEHLRWLVGWDDTLALDFVEDIDNATLKKLIQLAVPLWKEKGTAGALIDALRVFTGKSALVLDWFFHRWVIDEAGFWFEAGGSDPWLMGGRYTESGETLTHVIINREGLTVTERRFVHGLLTYVRPVGEHFCVIYAAFADDFGAGFDQWTNIGDAAALVTVDGDPRGGLDDGAEIQTNITAAEMDTWTPTQKALVFVQFSSSASTDIFQLLTMSNAAGTEYYGVTLKGDGTILLTKDGSTEASDTITLPTAGFSLGLEILVEPLDQATQKVTVLVGAEIRLTKEFVGADAYVDSIGGTRLKYDSAGDNRLYVDNALVLATPNRIQYVGQQAITPTDGVGGPQYIADPAPGLEDFVG